MQVLQPQVVLPECIFWQELDLRHVPPLTAERLIGFVKVQGLKQDELPDSPRLRRHFQAIDPVQARIRVFWL